MKAAFTDMRKLFILRVYLIAIIKNLPNVSMAKKPIMYLDKYHCSTDKIWFHNLIFASPLKF
ncbi:hypothetical protein PHYBLDRAFT_158446 [Phycomyces blakesleeanus NRRL 1555(-)]|uniref:Uncharacterized protein n=1 Tax=Phycomyces blakesleeanus (strain ATCC 8743b / DSM 1359 / FGSC 10004 / NBRC 33097 / NRRL 1555) TaxID=763407 RepID=A0A162PZ66_PHYB8|nr:hypothetical protein PHYBLDRAFT_158446 [Phycomyces blakesleeanus NRRL 1555(-)]OAD75666.1 hypothetical protein PHYBLDRAFT_158446 [Phycomyces blakesleeanus NRRL 1555(-)]|eukprot:XP_018293706.1 hypothetical protein PHYBLDRAFT_158446 [Phycomyces blakesleeanus NRRL 1555(-)]